MVSKGILAIWQIHEAIAFRGVPSEDLLRQFLVKRDDQAFRELLRRHGKDVYLQCRAVLRCEDLAHEAFQTTFIALAIKGHTIKSQRSVGAWLIKTARHKAISINRGIKARKKIEQAMGAELGDAVQGPPATSLNQQAEVFAALTELPEKYRTALTLCVIHGATHAEAAKELHWPQGTVDTRVRKGLELLKKKLERRGWGAAVALPVILAGTNVAEALPPLLVSTTLAGVLRVTEEQGSWALLTQVLAWKGWKTVAVALLMAIGLGGIGYTLSISEHTKDQPADSTIARQVDIQPVLYPLGLPGESLQSRNRRLFDERVSTRLKDALRPYVLGKGELVLTEVKTEGTLVSCILELRHRLGLKRYGIKDFTTKVRIRYDSRFGGVGLEGDEWGNGHWHGFGFNRPIILRNPLTGRDVYVELSGVHEAVNSFREGVPRVQLPTVPDFLPAGGLTQQEIVQIKPFLGDWYYQGTMASFIYVNQAGRCVSMSYQLEEWPMGFVRNAKGERRLGIEGCELIVTENGQRIHDVTNTSRWWSRERTGAPGKNAPPVRLHFDGGFW